VDIIPKPADIIYQVGEFRLTNDTSIVTDIANRSNAEYLRQLLAPPSGFHLDIRSENVERKNTISLKLNPGLEMLGLEGYRLTVNPDMAIMEAPTNTGIFYGIQSLRQLLPVEIEERRFSPGINWCIPCVFIEDQPRFPWRGFMLDEGRHFLGKETVLMILELMALHKLNTFHWHLTEDQGWRIEIIKYPKLTEIGSQRAGTSKTTWGRHHDGVPHQGFYTQEEIREIVTFAAQRNISIVPEIEMPGHSLAALASYPDLSCRGGPFEVATHFGIYPDIYCGGKEKVYTFLQDVLDEILNLFPSPYIHIGGDEVPKKRWKECPDCQQRIKAENLKDEHSLHAYFTRRIATYLGAKGRRGITWSDSPQEGLTSNLVMQFWVGKHKNMREAIRNKNRAVIMSPYFETYLDHGYSLLSLSRAYDYEPIPVEMGEAEEGSIFGLEFPLWSEWVPNRNRLDYQVFPRLTAQAEICWTQKDKRDYKDFLRRLNKFLIRMDRLGVCYASVKDADPAKIRQWFGIFTIPLPQTKTSGR
jgi:hexosaminidase